MKKIIILITACIILTFAFVSCGNDVGQTPDTSGVIDTTDIVTDESTAEVEISTAETEAPVSEAVTTEVPPESVVTTDTEVATTEPETTEPETTEELTTEAVTTEAPAGGGGAPAGGGGATSGGGSAPSGGGGGASSGSGTTEPTDPCVNGHDEEQHEAKAVTCTEAGWEAYVTCKRNGCDYTTKVEIPASHDKVENGALSATCIDEGWEAHVSCSRCDYTTKIAIPPTRFTDGEVPVFSLNNYRTVGQPSISTASEIKTPAVDGYASLSEYTAYRDLSPVGYAKTFLYDLDSTSVISATPVGAKNNLNSAQLQAIIDTEKVRYMIAEDGDNYYIAVQKISGATCDYVVTRNRWMFTFGLDMNDPKTQFSFDVIGQGRKDGWSSTAKKDALVYDFTMDYSIGNDRPLTLATSEYSDVVVAMMGSLRVAAIPTLLSSDYDDFIQKPTLHHYNGWAASSHLATIEMSLSKAAIRGHLGLDEDAELSDSLFFNVMINDQIVAAEQSSVGTIKKTPFETNSTAIVEQMYILWNGALITNASDKTAFDEAFIPDLLVFDEEMKLGCNFTAHTIDPEYLVAGLKDTYYHSCTDCGSIGTRTFKTDANGNLLYDCNSTEKIYEITAPSCSAKGVYKSNCSCGVVHETKTFEVDKLEHTWVDQDDDYRTPRTCSVCNNADSTIYVQKPEKKIKNILMIGNSFSYYFVEELYGIASANGYELNVANLYEWGCPVLDHWKWLHDGSNKYEFYVTNANGRVKKNDITTVSAALEYADWDVITFQQHFNPTRGLNYERAFGDTVQYAKNLFDYTKKNYPDALLFWHETWAYQVGYAVPEYYVGTVKDDVPIPDVKTQTDTYETIRRISYLIAAENCVNMIPSGDAWQIARSHLDVDNLCARKNNNGDLGDYYHDGDIGGGQYLNACVWFEALMGESCVGNTWRPGYTLGEEKIATLQRSAHEAVAVLYGPGYAQARPHEHDWQDATCTEPRTCEICFITEGEAAGHKNAAGQTVTIVCNSTVSDRYCIGCKSTIEVTHKFDANGKCEFCKAEVFTVPGGVSTYYATRLSSAPTLDGVISKDEYGTVYAVGAPGVKVESNGGISWSKANASLASEGMDYYFSYDDDYIYIAIHDEGPIYKNNADGYSKNDITFRHNYYFNFGFDLNDTSSYFSFGGASSSVQWNTLTYYKDGVAKSHSKKSYDLIDDAVIHKYKTNSAGEMGEYIAYGDIGSVNGNVNYTGGKWATVMEIRLDKSTVIQLMNETYGTSYEDISDAMWFSVSTRSYKAKTNDLEETDNENVVWLGQNNYLFDLVVFADDDRQIIVVAPDAAKEHCPNGHVAVSHKAQLPTYDAGGWNAYITCSACNYSSYVELPKIEKTFRTGYARTVVTPNVSEQKPLSGFKTVKDDIYATCVALNDGETTVLLLSVDMKSMSKDTCEAIRNRINKMTGVPTTNIFISATHDHSIVAFTNDSKWSFDAFHKMGQVAVEAIADLSDTQMYMGSGKTTGMAWVRRYVAADGTMSGVNPAPNSIRSVSEADDTLQMIRFVRDGKKDIAVANWQGHLAHAVNHFPQAICADMAHDLRQDIEAGDGDVLLVYVAGASGNINLSAPNASLVEYRSESNPKTNNNYYANVAKALAKVALEVLKEENLTKIEAGRIKVTSEVVAAKQKVDSPEDIAAAQAAKKAGTNTKKDDYLIARNKNATRDLSLSAVSLGELAFVTVPYEMFDNNGVQIKDASPFKMTMLLTNAHGDYAYMPSYEAWTEYFGYETEATYFGEGTAEDMVEEYIAMLYELYGIDEDGERYTFTEVDETVYVKDAHHIKVYGTPTFYCRDNLVGYSEDNMLGTLLYFGDGRSYKRVLYNDVWSALEIDGQIVYVSTRYITADEDKVVLDRLEGTAYAETNDASSKISLYGYTSDISSAVYQAVAQGTALNVSGISRDGEWYRVEFNYQGALQTLYIKKENAAMQVSQ